MKQSIFKKEVFATGSQGTVKAEIIATMNYTSTLDDFSKNIPLHKVEVFINGKILEKELELTSEFMLYKESKRLIKIAQAQCDHMSNSEPEKTFLEKMIDLFS